MGRQRNSKRTHGNFSIARFLQVISQNNQDPSSTNNHENAEITTPDPADSSERPSKKRRRDDDVEEDLPAVKKIEIAKTNPSHSDWVKSYDMTGTVPTFVTIQDVPDNLRKYFAQRERFFSLYSTPPGCLLDEEGWYSVTPERIADQIAERCRCDTILDPFCGVGGNAIAFAKTCQRVIALDISPTRLALARHNAQVYGVAHRIEFILADYVSFAESYLSFPHSSSSSRKIDVVFLSPPWGGPSYLEGLITPESKDSEAENSSHPVYSLSSIQPIHGTELFKLSRRITKNIAYYLPRNTDLNEVSSMVEQSSCENEEVEEYIEVEEEWMGRKLKALTCYFGGLADGQGEMF